MGTRADWYIGRGDKAEWLGSTAWDGNPGSIEEGGFLGSKTADDFRAAVNKFLASRDDGTVPSQGWPWPWEDSGTTDYSYALDDGVVYITCFGHGWYSYEEWKAHEAEVNEYYRAHKELAEKGLDNDAIHDKLGDEPDGLWENDSDDPCVFPNMKDVQNVTFGRRSGVIILRG